MTRPLGGQGLGLWLVGLVLVGLHSASVGATPAMVVVPAAGASLRAQYTLLQTELAQNEFKQPLVVRSDESNGKILGEVFAVVDFPLAQVVQGLNSPVHWCDVMILHINTKYCIAKPGPQGKWLKSAQVRALLNISPGTLLNLRVNGHLRYTKVGGIFYYQYQDIELMLAKDPSKKR